MAEITFVGTGEATDPDLPNTSILYRGERTLLLDCGYSVPRAFWQVSRDPSLLDAITITHRHGDHTFGLPGLLLWMRERGRTDPLRIFAGAETARILAEVIELAYPGLLANASMYPVDIVPVLEQVEIGPVALRLAESDHGAVNHAVRIEEGGHAVCYSGDGGMTDETRALYQGAELLVHECYDEAPRTSGHANARELIAEARELGVGRLALVHVSVAARASVRALVGRETGVRVAMPSPGDRITVGER